MLGVKTKITLIIHSSATWLLSVAELTPTGSYLPDNVVASAGLKEDTEHQGDFVDRVILAGQGVSVCAEGVAHGAYHPLKPLLLRI